MTIVIIIISLLLLFDNSIVTRNGEGWFWTLVLLIKENREFYKATSSWYHHLIYERKIWKYFQKSEKHSKYNFQLSHINTLHSTYILTHHPRQPIIDRESDIFQSQFTTNSNKMFLLIRKSNFLISIFNKQIWNNIPIQ